MPFDLKAASFDTDESLIFKRILNESRWEKISVHRVFASKELDGFVCGKLKEIFKGSMESIGREKVFYRARIVKKPDEMYDAEDMGAPPVEKVNRGRVQPEGFPVLYTATKRLIALGEVRPSVGDTVATAECRVKDARELKILDIGLRGVPYSSIMNEQKESIDFIELNRLIRAVRFSMLNFSKPVNELDFDRYRDTIYISQKIQEMGYDGVSYLSSLWPNFGKNYAFFCPSHFEFKVISHRIVNNKILQLMN